MNENIRYTGPIGMKPFKFQEDLVIGRAKCVQPELEYEWIIENGVIGSSVGNDFISRCLKEAEACISKNMKWGEIGPTLTTRLIHELGLLEQTQPQRVFASFPWHKWYRAVDARPLYSFLFWWYYLLQGGHSIHLSNEMWGRKNLDKDASFPSYTMYERLKRRYGMV